MENRAIDIITIIKNPDDYPLDMVSRAIAALPDMINQFKIEGRADKAVFITRESIIYNFELGENYKSYITISNPIYSERSWFSNIEKS